MRDCVESAFSSNSLFVERGKRNLRVPLTYTICVTIDVGWSEVGWYDTEDVTNRHLVVDHLIREVCIRKCVQFLVRPGVTGNLMTGIIHSLGNG